ncbi:DUF2703 domain-containing protein [Geobacter grbiciae]|uniref:DUF2703 domain-containing protein n=1 Tax=Geobacter grbiciae TaxID=155042 RepID=UPI001C037394|nr:DUF2703 domain-containing protein [Geobacter grbiciae]MBT1075332.1 DUF2703 domain-containing protein [Geobacter grbiciae]
MKDLTIEWRHYDKEGATCIRCSATGQSLEGVIAGLRDELSPQGVRIVFTETRLTEERISESNLILLNGIPLEELLAEAQASENTCQSCSCLTGAETSCRTIEFEGKTHEEIPADLIRAAAYKALGLR